MSPDISGAASTAGAEGILLHVRQLGASVLAHVAMRIELLSIEVQEEKIRLARLAISAALVSALLIVSVVMLAVLVLAVFWDTPNRVPAALSLAVTFIALTIGGGVYVAAQLRRSTNLLATSACELRRDADAMAAPSPAQ